MEYTPTERLKRIWALAMADPDCVTCRQEMEQSESQMAEYTDHHPDTRGLWAFPVSLQVYFGRVLELVSREMRFPEEQ